MVICCLLKVNSLFVFAKKLFWHYKTDRFHCCLSHSFSSFFFFSPPNFYVSEQQKTSKKSKMYDLKFSRQFTLPKPTLYHNNFTGIQKKFFWNEIKIGITT